MNLLGWQWNACGLPGWRGGGILKLQIDRCFMFMYKVLFLVGAYLRSDQLVTSHWNSSMLPYKQVMKNEKLIGFRVLSWYTSKFSCLIYKEQHGNQWGELLIGCWEVKGLKLSTNVTNFTTYMKVLVRNPLMWSNVNRDLLRMIMVQNKAMQMQ